MTERTWPTDHLTDAEHRLARLWNTIRTVDDDEDVHLTDDREAILFAIEDSLEKAELATGGLDPKAPLGPLLRLTDLVGWVKADLRKGLPGIEFVGPGSYAAQIEEAIEALWAAWEPIERQNGRPPLTHDEAVADVAERLTWDKY